ncbi:Mechanosensitive ion channel protein 10-like protein [Drosera capensis]
MASFLGTSSSSLTTILSMMSSTLPSRDSRDVRTSFDLALPLRMVTFGAFPSSNSVMYVEENPHLWHSCHGIIVKEIENVNKLKMGIFFNHTMNFQNFREKMREHLNLSWK